jgi:hypothetical protein
MLSKCANPACSNKFRYLSEGKLYLIDAKATSVRDGKPAEFTYAGKPCSFEYFWLCTSCCQDMMILISDRLEIGVVRKPEILQVSNPAREGPSASNKTNAA